MNIYESITKVMSESIAIGKDSYNKQQNFKYRGIDAVMNTFYPLFSKHKIFIVPEVLEQTREERTTKNGGNLIYSILKVKYTFYAEDGTSISATVMGEGMDSADKSGNKAMSVAFKYAMFQVFCIPTEEMRDPDAESFEESSPVKYLCSGCGKPFAPFKDNNGKTWTARQIYELSMRKNADGKARCADCRKRHEKSLAEQLKED